MYTFSYNFIIILLKEFPENDHIWFHGVKCYEPNKCMDFNKAKYNTFFKKEQNSLKNSAWTSFGLSFKSISL